MLEKTAVILFNYGLNFSFKMLFEDYLGGKKAVTFPCKAFLSCF